MASIRFDKVTFGYVSALPMFQSLSLQLQGDTSERQGHLIAIMGPSGSGKTTLLRLVSGVEKPLAGSLNLSPASASVSYLQQEPVLFEHLSPKENARYFTLVQATRAQFDEATYQRLAEKLRLRTVLETGRRVEDLSGGERQRLSLLRALSIRPKVLLLDEPCTGLDIGVKLEFLHMLREVVDDLRLLALYVTHHSDEAELVANDLLYLTVSPFDRSVTASLISMADALRQPPSIEAAQSFTNPGGNVLSCFLKESGMITSLSGHVIGHLQCRHIPPGKYDVVFPPESVVWNRLSEQHVEAVGQSTQYWFVHISGGEKVVGPRTDSQPISFSLNGVGILFPEDGGPGTRTTISS